MAENTEGSNGNGKKDEPPDPTAWDRVGRLLEEMAGVANTVAQRNLKLWTDVSQDLRAGKPYTMDKMANDSARALQAAVDNATDMWNFWTRLPERERVAEVLPTAFLYFARKDVGKGTHAPADVVWIRVPFRDVEDLPKRAEIELAGGPGPDEADAVLKTLTALLGPTKRAYRLEPSSVESLPPGTYSGSVYIIRDSQVRPLANLRVVVAA